MEDGYLFQGDMVFTKEEIRTAMAGGDVNSVGSNAYGMMNSVRKKGRMELFLISQKSVSVETKFFSKVTLIGFIYPFLSNVTFLYSLKKLLTFSGGTEI